MDFRVGGAFAENVHATWRWAFYINLCIGGAFAPVYIFYLPRGDPQPDCGTMQKLKQIDFLGVILNAGAFTALIMAIDFGGNLYSWSAGQEIALWTVGGILLVGFTLQQRFKIGTTERQRIFPADFLQKPIMWLLFTLMCAASTCVVVSDPLSPWERKYILILPFRSPPTTSHCTSNLYVGTAPCLPPSACSPLSPRWCLWGS